MGRLPLSAWQLTEDGFPWLLRILWHVFGSMCWTGPPAARSAWVAATRELGVSRSRRHELRDRYHRYGEVGLLPKPRPAGTHPAAVSPTRAPGSRPRRFRRPHG